MKAVWDAAASAIMGALGTVPPWGVKVVFIGIFIALAAWALSLPKSYIFKGADDTAMWRDLRVWAVVVIVLEIIPYLFF